MQAAPGKRVGILGGGQLGRMLALAGHRLGVRVTCLDPSPDAPAGQCADLITAEYSDAAALKELCRDIDALTYEFENVPGDALAALPPGVRVYPPPQALLVSQERVAEKNFFVSIGVPTARFAPVASEHALSATAKEIGFACVLKTCRLGYDGKGQFVLRGPEDLEAALPLVEGRALMLEEFVAFDRELSIIAVRALNGDVAFYPLVENVHERGILRTSRAPAREVTPALQAEAEQHARRILEKLSYVGVLAIEFFCKGGNLLANEMAPRVHNSGHWTIDGAETSQFENHLRAVCGLPLGSTAARGHAAMVNIIGNCPPLEKLTAVRGASIHLYGKSARAGRKIGHVNLCCASAAELEARLAEVSALCRG